MAVPATLPAPRSNLTATRLSASAANIVAADIIVATGDFTGGASEDLWTLSAHGLVDGDVLHCLWHSATGVVTGGEGTRGIVNELSSSTFQLTTDGSTVIENTADGTAVFLKGRTASAFVETAVLPNILAGTNDTTGGTVEDMVVVSSQRGAIDGDSIKLLYKSAAGAAAVAVDATVFVKAPVQSAAAAYFQTSLTAGGAVADTTADGTVVFLKTS